MATEKILVMNLGSTSSKIAVYEDDKELFNDGLLQTLRQIEPETAEQIQSALTSPVKDEQP